MQAREGKIDLARFSLQPLAADPHGGPRSELAKKLIAVLDVAPEGTPLTLRPGQAGGADGGDADDAADSES